MESSLVRESCTERFSLRPPIRLLESAHERLVRRRPEEVEGKPVRGPGAHPRKPRQLRDEILDRRAEHAAIVPVRIGPDRCRKPLAADPAR